jgi:RNA polymerase sigma-70 factor (ECF subfamily)
MRAADASGTYLAMTEAARDSALKAGTADKIVSIEDLLTFQETVFLICLGFSRNYAVAEDLAQEAYPRACQSLPGLREPRLAKGWLYRIARNVCLDHQKKTRVRGRLLRRWARESVPNPAPEVMDEIPDSRIVRLKSTAGCLPKKLRDVFVLREYGHLSYDELAAALRINKGTVMSRLNRARRRIVASFREQSHE